MLTLSLKTKYGLTAMLALAEQYQSAPLQSRSIAETAGIPQNYLEQVLSELKKSALLQSFRGSQGGYALVKDPSEITVKEIVTCLEGPIRFSSDSEDKGLDFFWKDLETQVQAVFEISLASLLEQKKRHDQVLSYMI